MADGIVVPYTSSVGSQFLINFKEFESQEDFSIPVIDVSLILVEAKDEAIGMRDLIAISRIVSDFLNNNKVVLYYYCDHSSDDIFISERHQGMSPVICEAERGKGLRPSSIASLGIIDTESMSEASCTAN